MGLPDTSGRHEVDALPVGRDERIRLDRSGRCAVRRWHRIHPADTALVNWRRGKDGSMGLEIDQ
jgi:hypothetical protein